MSPPPLVFTHMHKCSGSSMRHMLYAKFEPIFGHHRLHIPELTCDAFGNLPMKAERGEALPENILLLADHSPFGRFDARVLAPGRPYRITFLREPFDRFESYYHFCARCEFIPEEWARHTHDVSAMSDAELAALCEFFEEDSGYLYWFDPDHRDRDTAIANLLSYDIVGPYDDLTSFCARFNRSNPYGVTFDPAEVRHVNTTDRPSRFTPAQRELAREKLANDYFVWHSPAVRRAMADGRPPLSAATR